MLSKAEVQLKMYAFECPLYLHDLCYKPIQEQAILAIELQAKLDEIEKWCNSPITFDDFGYQMAINYVRNVLKGGESEDE